jgi:hypothetical protein
MTPPAQGILYLDSFLAFLPSSRFDNFAADPKGHDATVPADLELRRPSDDGRHRQRIPEGRLLLIGTTDLDAQRPVIWNIGAIAASGRPGAVELMRKILLASAAISPPSRRCS